MPQMGNSFKCGTIMRCMVCVLSVFRIYDEMHIYGTCRANENILWNASLRENPLYILYMFVLCKPGEEQFSESSEAVVLLTVLLSGVPVGVV